MEDKEIRDLGSVNSEVRKLTPDQQDLYHRVVMKERIENQKLSGGSGNVPVADRWDIYEMIKSGEITEESLQKPTPPKPPRQPQTGGTHAGFSGEAMDRADQKREEDMMQRVTGKLDSDTEEDLSNP